MKKNETTSFRDLSVLKVDPAHTLLVACESSASIGEKPADHLQVAVELTARMALRVCLVELLSQRAEPIAVFSLVGNERRPTGERVWQALKEELQALPFDHEIELNGSTEDNMSSSQSSLGLVALGQLEGEFDLPDYQQVRSIIQLATPYVGQAVVDHLDDLPTYAQVVQWALDERVVDLIPVGHQGSQADLADLFDHHDLGLTRVDSPWLGLSAGPSTSFILLLSSEDVPADLVAGYDYEWLAVVDD